MVLFTWTDVFTKLPVLQWLKNRASVCDQRQFDAPWCGGQAGQGREWQPSVAVPNIWMTLYIYHHHHQSILPKGRSFTANPGTKVALLSKGRSSTANSGTKVEVLLWINTCGSFPLICAIDIDTINVLKLNNKIMKTDMKGDKILNRNQKTEHKEPQVIVTLNTIAIQSRLAWQSSHIFLNRLW